MKEKWGVRDEKKGEKKTKNLLEREVSRCNKDFFVFNLSLTIIIAFLFLAPLILSGSNILLTIALTLISLIYPGYNYYIIYKRLKDYKNHPIYKSFLRFGEPIKIADIIENELKKKILFEKDGKIITQNWIIIKNFSNFKVIHSTEICWVYILQTRHSVNGIPVGSSYSVRLNYYEQKLNSLYTKSTEISCKNKEKAEEFIETIQSFSPWAIYGFNEEIKYLWKNKSQILIQETNQRIAEVHKLIEEYGKRKKD